MALIDLSANPCPDRNLRKHPKLRSLQAGPGNLQADERPVRGLPATQLQQCCNRVSDGRPGCLLVSVGSRRNGIQNFEELLSTIQS